MKLFTRIGFILALMIFTSTVSLSAETSNGLSETRNCDSRTFSDLLDSMSNTMSDTRASSIKFASMIMPVIIKLQVAQCYGEYRENEPNHAGEVTSIQLSVGQGFYALAVLSDGAIVATITESSEGCVISGETEMASLIVLENTYLLSLCTITVEVRTVNGTYWKLGFFEVTD